MIEAPAAPILEARRIRKCFGRLVALDGVDFAIREGEIHALIGENGAGKSTLMGVLYGMHAPDDGAVFVRGRQVRFNGCVDAMRAGIGMVFQHFLLIDRFSVAENVMLGREPSRHGFVDREAAAATAAAVARRYGFGVDAAAPVENLGIGARQQVELLKVLERDAKIVILDEPTAALSPAETGALFDVIRTMRDEGRAVAFIAHKLKEVLEIADRITVLRRGMIVGSVARGEADASTLATMMVGPDVDLHERVARAGRPGAAALEVRDLDVCRDDGAPALRALTLDVRAGEIVGIAGVEGNGQLEFAEAVYGLRPAVRGSISLAGRNITASSVSERRLLGLRYIPADRLREGLVLDFDAAENAMLGDQRRNRDVVIDVADARDRAERIASEYSLAGYSPSTPVREYSGGTQQKLIVGRELTRDAVLVLAFAPTRGVDVGAAAAIHRRLREVRDAGAAVVLVSYDLDEIRALADRIAVFSAGTVAGMLAPDAADDAALGRLMGGIAADA